MAGPVVTIRYCTGCRWLLRAQWYAAELLSTFERDLGAVTLVPSDGATFRVDVDGEVVWNRKSDGGFPDAADLKRRVRDVIDPGRSLGHSDGPGDSSGDGSGSGPTGGVGGAT